MTLNIAKHKNVMVRILKDIFTDHAISPFLGFKGGTAAYLFYGLNRFSVDLDFDLLDETQTEQVFDRVKEILETYGKLKAADKKKFTLFFLLSYDDKEFHAQNVKVEINLRNLGSKYEIKSYLGISMKVMAKADMLANKLVAMYERIGKTNRDIFDVQYFLQNNWPVRKEIVENRTGISFAKFLKKSIAELSKVHEKDILAGMGELLTEKQKAWVKTKLKSETIFLLRLALENEKQEIRNQYI
jgi:predicted nucleotidyltransferase component of viral defense system